MINFSDCFTPEIVLARADKYYNEENYTTYIKFIANLYDKFDKEIQIQLLEKLAMIYEKWNSIDKAIIVLKFACVLDDRNLVLHYHLTRLISLTDDKLAFQESFFKLSLLDMYHEYLPEFANMLEDFEDDDFQLVNDEFKYKRLKNHCESMLLVNESEGIDCLDEMLQSYPGDKWALNTIIYYHATIGDESLVKNYADQLIKYNSDDIDSICMYLFIYLEDEDFDGSIYFNKLLHAKITSVETLRKVIAVFEIREYYDSIEKILNNFVQTEEHKYNYDYMLMHAILSFDKGEYDAAMNELANIETLYGELGFTKYYKILFEFNKERFISIAKTNILAEDFIYVLHSLLKSISEKKLYENEVDTEKFQLAIELLCLLGIQEDLDLIIKNLTRHTKQLDVDKLIKFINTHEIPQSCKARVIKMLLDLGVKSFPLFTLGRVDNIEYVPIKELDDYPISYKNAYHYAFAYLSLSVMDFSDSLVKSTKQLLKAMENNRKPFRNNLALAGAIICNSYSIMSDNIVENVAEMIGCTEESINKCIKDIQSNGDFYDLNKDEAFIEHLKSMMSKFGDIEIFE